MPVEPPVYPLAIDVVKRVHIQGTPLDVDPGPIGVAEPILEVDVEFGGIDDVVERGFFDQGFEIEPEGPDPLEGGQIDRAEVAAPVTVGHAVSSVLASS